MESRPKSVRKNSPAPTTSNVESAIWKATIALPLMPRRRRVTVCALSFKLLLTSLRAASHAGARPKINPVNRVTPAAKANTPQSIRTLRSLCSQPLPSNEGIALRPRYPSSRPPAPPMAASSKLSVSNWRRIRPRPAPRASRTLISRCRCEPRASSRLAMFAHASNSTNPVSVIST